MGTENEIKPEVKTETEVQKVTEKDRVTERVTEKEKVTDKVAGKVNDKGSNKTKKKSNTKKGAKKSNLLNIALFLTVLIAVVTVVYVYQVFFKDGGNDTKTVSGLNPTNEAMATTVYNRIMSYDLDKVYPQNVEEVMNLYNDTVYMLYGDMIVDKDLAKQVLEQQRKICSDELINGLGLDEQFLNLETSLGLLKEQGVICLGAEVKMVKYSQDDSNICTISVKSSFTAGTTIYRNYILYKNDKKGRWEVYSWEQTDANFNPKVS